jgi:hypothetical protein
MLKNGQDLHRLRVNSHASDFQCTYKLLQRRIYRLMATPCRYNTCSKMSSFPPELQPILSNRRTVDKHMKQTNYKPFLVTLIIDPDGNLTSPTGCRDRHHIFHLHHLHHLHYLYVTRSYINPISHILIT